MTPYYQHGGITIYHGDCREVSVERADAIVTDPPYGETSLEWDKQVRGWMDSAEFGTHHAWPTIKRDKLRHLSQAVIEFTTVC
jgi:site-specific DNA-methyltransferase (adenine-specific)